MRDRVQEQEQTGLDHGSGRQDLVHRLGRGHEKRILQNVERARAQRLKGALREDLRAHVVRVCEIGGEERRERSEPIVRSAAHVAERRLGPFRKGCSGRVHYYVLQCFLHRDTSLRLRLADECRNRHVLNRCPLQVESFEIFVRGVSEDLHVLAERVAGLRPKDFRALEHLELSNGVRSKRRELWRVPSSVRVRCVPSALDSHV